MRKNRILSLIAISILLLSFSACSSLPSEANGRESLERRGSQEDGFYRFSVKSFRKTNGQEQEVSGVKLYKMEFVAEIKCERDHSFSGDISLFCHKDEVSTRTGSVSFEKTEQGWIAKNITLR